MTENRARHVIDLAGEVVVDLLQTMVRLDTTVHDHAESPRDDAKLQAFIADFLAGLGAEVDLFEPDPAELADHPRFPADLSFVGRPVLVAKFPGTGAGRSVILNGHYDTVPAGPVEEWTFSPWDAVVDDGKLHGRGACDMKGGIAVALAVMHGLVGAGVRLAGDVYINTVPYEEISGMGTVATVRRGYRADAAICLEPSGLTQPQTACRGLLMAELIVHGRSAHAEAPIPDVGYGVSAIDKLMDVLSGLRALTAEWRYRDSKQHPHLTVPHVLPTMISGGDFPYTYPASATATLNIPYLPADADETGFGQLVRDEVEQCVAASASADEWLREHPPEVRWLMDLPPMELPADEPLIASVLSAANKRGHPATSFPSDIWSDIATFVIEGGVPAVSYSGGSGDQAHSVDEYVALSELTHTIEILVDFLLAWTGETSAVTTPAAGGASTSDGIL